MSYSSTTILTFGVHIDETTAFHLYQNFYIEGELNFDYELGDVFYRRKDPISIFSQSLPVTSYKSHDVGHSCLFDVQIWAENTDSRIHNLVFEKGKQHVFGIHIASCGYGYQDKLSYFMKKIPSIALCNFEKYCLPILKMNQLTLSPEIILVQQTH